MVQQLWVSYFVNDTDGTMKPSYYWSLANYLKPLYLYGTTNNFDHTQVARWRRRLHPRIMACQISCWRRKEPAADDDKRNDCVHHQPGSQHFLLNSTPLKDIRFWILLSKPYHPVWFCAFPSLWTVAWFPKTTGKLQWWPYWDRLRSA